MKPLCIDLFCGLGGWTDGFLAEGYDVVGFDIERHDYGTGGYPAQLVIQDVLTLHGSQFKDAAVIVASPPCQEFSYMAMPWTRAKAKAVFIRKSPAEQERLTALFRACFRIAAEAGVPLVVENVKGAQPWVGRAKFHYGSFYLWGDVPALMPSARQFKSQGMNWSDRTKHGQDFTRLAGRHSTIKGTGGSWFTPTEEGRTKQGHWRDGGCITRQFNSKSNSRKAASAQIAKIPFPLAQHIARCFKPDIEAVS